MSQWLRQNMVRVAAVVALLALQAAALGEELKKSVSPQVGKLDQKDTDGSIGEPQYGYVGALGSFQVTKDGGKGMIVVHNYPDTATHALGETKLEYVGPKRIGDVDGWVFNTRWDGSQYPSKVFFSADPVYFGGGQTAYIAADYREATGWAWKLLPLRRMDLAQD
ncbi:MAG TPA: hypothetical protein VHV55_02190 [Pirellulales bacterium]|jgi:hypothetical protein|nr:hypothetical protein [Pirellulales bacterium]